MKKERFHDSQEEKNKKRGILITFWMHIGLLSLAFFPLMGSMTDLGLTEKEEPKGLEMQYVELVTPQPKEESETTFTAKQTNNKKAAESPKAEEPKPTPEPEPQPEPTPAPQPKPVETVEDNETPAVQESPKPSNEVNSKTSPVSGKKTPKTTNTSKAGNSKTTTKNTSNAGSKNGKGTSDEVSDEDLGNGVFGRRIVYRPNIKSLFRKAGNISVKVAVNQEGKVLVSRFLPQYSSINDPELVAMVLKAVRKYRFDRDYTVAKKQWGKLNFIFKRR